MSPDASTRERTVVPSALTEAEWSPFGWLPVADVDPRDGEQTMTFEWADAHVNLIGHARSEVPETPDVACAATCCSGMTPTPRP